MVKEQRKTTKNKMLEEEMSKNPVKNLIHMQTNKGKKVKAQAGKNAEKTKRPLAGKTVLTTKRAVQ